MFTMKNEDLKNGTKIICRNINFEIENEQHVALIGRNGIGKTTLLNKIKDKFNAGMLNQENENLDITLLDFCLSTYPELLKIKNRMTHDYHAMEDYTSQGGYETEHEIIIQLKKFGFNEKDIDRKMSTLSGGEITKVSIVKLLSQNYELFIFDEPTNHIDNETKNWLIKWMNESKHTIIYATHDRSFINKTAHKILELSDEGLRTFNLNYDGYKVQKEIEHETNQNLIEKERKERRKIKSMIQEYKEWFHKANNKASVRNPSEQKKVAKIAKRYKTKEQQLLQKERNYQGQIVKQERTDYSLNTQKTNIKNFLSFYNVSYIIENKTIFNNVSFSIKQSEKICISGKNGSGKSTLLKLILNEIQPTSGKININPSIEIGYFSQHLEVLNMNRTVLEEILLIKDMTESYARTILASFRFKETLIGEKIHHLSMGEKCRLAIAKLFFQNPHLLILDEPTNYFDIEMQEILEDMLLQYKGTLIFVSHDRYFQEKIATRTLTIHNKMLIDTEKHISEPLNTDVLIDQLNKLEDAANTELL
ncbi:ABC-F family ATP-binding cassette domain-containing protein [Macrococcus caseolyticus]|uniref:ribosomal protection-like ABC-F family protein n=1 Tax=Macrococcoides caseolyticum TaxID=69966 RepID=UPI0024BC4835|nr:ABC-F family ATP-binding cassette domain-containing protein [Macrococcus caseolyticus]MDJ1091839.1 ABC-F family ATP-binding cassette domain-containing protein [Macrococcus caseolyticus]MDJ1153987.1 ABC-F family ATP-binding cassette domain-containing protein [Macrococcus caseolyticus]